MKKLTLTLCVLASTAALAACETGTTYDSGSSFANERTAGKTEGAKPAPKAERVFREVQTK